jgi:hypothetical protein
MNLYNKQLHGRCTALNLPRDKFPLFSNHGRQVMSLFFGSTCMCEYLLSKMSTGKNSYRNRFEHQVLDGCLRVATSQISHHINGLVTSKQYQFSQ